MPCEKPTSEAERIAGSFRRHLFARDGAITDAELTFIKKLGLRDFKIDQRELSVLDAITNQLQRKRVSPPAWEEIKRFRHKYSLPPLPEPD